MAENEHKAIIGSRLTRGPAVETKTAGFPARLCDRLGKERAVLFAQGYNQAMNDLLVLAQIGERLIPFHKLLSDEMAVALSRVTIALQKMREAVIG